MHAIFCLITTVYVCGKNFAILQFLLTLQMFFLQMLLMQGQGQGISRCSHESLS